MFEPPFPRGDETCTEANMKPLMVNLHTTSLRKLENTEIKLEDGAVESEKQEVPRPQQSAEPGVSEVRLGWIPLSWWGR